MIALTIMGELLNQCEVLVTGTFNFCHSGHCELFEWANKFGKVTVGINTDVYLKKKYGSQYVPLTQRMHVLSCNKLIDNVVCFNEEHPGKLILKLRPIYYVKGPDYLNIDLPEMPQIIDSKTKLIICESKKIQNSSRLLRLYK